MSGRVLLAYLDGVATGLQTMVAATYVRDIDESRAFYELLGFGEHSSGRAATSAWCSLHQGTYQVLLAYTNPPLDVPALPLHFYFFYDDVDATVRGLETAGVAVDHLGFPVHALGGELRLTDPDGNTVLIGQRERSVSQPPLADQAASSRFSLLREAAARVATLSGAEGRCQIGEPAGTPCLRQAEVKLADPSGSSAWACLDHADEILLVVRGAFIALQGETGLAEFLAHRAPDRAAH
jgi:catechol 2,3-dioxygenase-like lactoylglutathione lyase family enzyme